MAGIGRLQDARAILEGRAGTRVRAQPNGSGLEADAPEVQRLA
jgi:hypothetical protein